MQENVISFQSVIENGIIRLPEEYRETFNAPVLVTVRDNSLKEELTADEITARLNTIYNDNEATVEEDIQLLQYNLISNEDWQA